MIEVNAQGGIVVSWVSDTHRESHTYYNFTPAEAAADFVQRYPKSAAEVIYYLDAYLQEQLESHITLAIKILVPFEQSSLFADYKSEDGWTDAQFHDMLGAFKTFNGHQDSEDDEE